MNITRTIETVFRRFLPSPFAIAVILTLVTILLALFFTNGPSDKNHILAILSYWESGVWSNGLLVFAYQMMLILVLGHILVLSKPMNKLIQGLTNYVTNTRNAVILVSTTTMLVSFFNWGLGLIFGAILARKVAEAAQTRGFQINYPLVGAAGYVGLMIWHGGISGSAPSKVSERGHLTSFMEQISDPELQAQIPDLIPYSETIFSGFNLLLFGILLVIIPLFLAFLSRNLPTTLTNLPIYEGPDSHKEGEVEVGRIDRSWVFG
ncbi:MAG: TIGR00366 family protein, partial [Bacteroidia bacterium]|nr:TIGR00366 family protein [Bacteroidia bacterium]